VLLGQVLADAVVW